ncbi:hypothetical protein NE237_027946 [Protea cynaroides]|uniref:Uncharacterized protein n=1 Tax=Protea cynaroides TaxID=273540 RepID=A0A9Q0GSV1_9MAGN|nr:hypothetical protein NE237_027946 [Protea cynaroides]
MDGEGAYVTGNGAGSSGCGGEGSMADGGNEESRRGGLLSVTKGNGVCLVGDNGKMMSSLEICYDGDKMLGSGSGGMRSRQASKGTQETTLSQSDSFVCDMAYWKEHEDGGEGSASLSFPLACWPWILSLCKGWTLKPVPKSSLPLPDYVKLAAWI